MHLATDANGLPINFKITGGDVHDSQVAKQQINIVGKATYLIVDKGYDAEHIRIYAQNKDMLRILTDRGTEYCCKVEQYDYELYLALNDIDHTKTRAALPQTKGICERFHKTILQEFYQITFRKKLYSTLEKLQRDLATG